MFGRARNDPFEHRIAPAVHMARCQLFTRPNMALHEHPCARVLFALHAPTIHTGECVQQRSGLYQLVGCTFVSGRASFERPRANGRHGQRHNSRCCRVCCLPLGCPCMCLLNRVSHLCWHLVLRFLIYGLYSRSSHPQPHAHQIQIHKISRDSKDISQL